MTIKQKQCLLAYLGYYVGEVDGIWGQLSKAATEAFQKDFGLKDSGTVDSETEKALKHAVAYGMPAREPEDEPQDTSSEKEALEKLFEGIRYWSPEEFKCRCGEYHAPYCNGFPALPDRKLLDLADDVREHFGRPGIRTSGIRCYQHNISIPRARWAAVT